MCFDSPSRLSSFFPSLCARALSLPLSRVSSFTLGRAITHPHPPHRSLTGVHTTSGGHPRPAQFPRWTEKERKCGGRCARAAGRERVFPFQCLGWTASHSTHPAKRMGGQGENKMRTGPALGLARKLSPCAMDECKLLARGHQCGSVWPSAGRRQDRRIRRPLLRPLNTPAQSSGPIVVMRCLGVTR